MTTLLLAVDSAGTAAAYRAVLGEASDVEVLGAATDSTELLEMAAALNPEVVLLDENIGPLPALDLARELAYQSPHVAVVLAAREVTASLFSEAMGYGIRGLVALPLALEEVHERLGTAAEWARGVRRVMLADVSSSDLGQVSGRVFTIAGAKGGVGTTTLAVRLALAATREKVRVCLIDLDLQKGDIPTLLDITHRRSIHDLVEVVDDISARAIDETVYAHVSGMRVLLAPAEGERAEEITDRVARNVISAVRARYDVVIIDVGAHLTEAGAVAVDLANEVILLSTADVLSMKAARRLARMWVRLQIRKEEDVRVLFTGVSKQNEIQPDLARKTVGLPSLRTTVPAAFRALESSVNTASPDRLDDAALVRSYAAVALEVGMVRGDDAAVDGSRHRRRLGRDSGQASIELLGILPLILIGLLVLWQFTLLGMTWMFAEHAASAAARESSLGASAQQVSQTGLDRVPGAWRDGTTVVPETPAGGVTVHMQTPLVIPGLFTTGLSFTTHAQSVREP